MKVRTDFVTNSSSSSFIILSKVDRCAELEQYMKDEYGKYGIRLLDSYLRHLKDYIYHYGDRMVYDFDGYEFEPYELSEKGVDLSDEDAQYLVSTFTWSTGGDTDGDDAWLYKKIPKKYRKDIYESDPG